MVPRGAAGHVTTLVPLPNSLALGIYFAGGLVCCIYKGFWVDAAFTAAALSAHVFLVAIPSRRAWTARRASRRTAN
jgi:hypothetical protein